MHEPIYTEIHVKSSRDLWCPSQLRPWDMRLNQGIGWRCHLCHLDWISKRCMLGLWHEPACNETPDTNHLWRPEDWADSETCPVLVILAFKVPLKGWEISRGGWVNRRLIGVSSPGAKKKCRPGSTRLTVWLLCSLLHHFQRQLALRKSSVAHFCQPPLQNCLRWAGFI